MDCNHTWDVTKFQDGSVGLDCQKCGLRMTAGYAMHFFDKNTGFIGKLDLHDYQLTTFKLGVRKEKV